MKMQLPARCRCRWRFATAAAALRVHCKYFIIAQFRQLIPPAYECIGERCTMPCHAMEQESPGGRKAAGRMQVS